MTAVLAHCAVCFHIVLNIVPNAVKVQPLSLQDGFDFWKQPKVIQSDESGMCNIFLDEKQRYFPKMIGHF